MKKQSTDEYYIEINMNVSYNTVLTLLTKWLFKLDGKGVVSWGKLRAKWMNVY